MPFQFVLPRLSTLPNIPLSVLPQSPNKAEQKKEWGASVQTPWRYTAFKESLRDLEISPVRDFLLEVADMNGSSAQKEQALREKYKALFKDEAQVRQLLTTILAVRHRTITSIHQDPPQGTENEFECLTETQKRIEFMARVGIILQKTFIQASYASEHCQFLSAFFDDIRVDMENIINGARIDFASKHGNLISFVERNTVMVDIFFRQVTARLEQGPLNDVDREQLFSMCQYWMLFYKDKAAFYFVLGMDSTAKDILKEGSNFCIDLEPTFESIKQWYDQSKIAEKYKAIYGTACVQYDELVKNIEKDETRKAYAEILSAANMLSSPIVSTQFTTDIKSKLETSQAELRSKQFTKQITTPASIAVIKKSITFLQAARSNNYYNDLDVISRCNGIIRQLQSIMDAQEQNIVVLIIKEKLKQYTKSIQASELSVRQSVKETLGSKGKGSLVLIASLQAEINTLKEQLTPEVDFQEKMTQVQMHNERLIGEFAASEQKLRELMAQFKTSQAEIEALKSAQAQKTSEIPQTPAAVYQSWHPQPVVLQNLQMLPPPILPEGIPCRYYRSLYLEYNDTIISALSYNPIQVIHCLRKFVQDNRPFRPNHDAAVRQAIIQCRRTNFRSFLALLSLVGRNTRSSDAFKRLYNSAYLTDIFPFMPDFKRPFMGAWVEFVTLELENSARNGRVIDGYAFLNLLLLAEYQLGKASDPTQIVDQQINTLSTQLIDIMKPMSLGDTHQLKTRISQGLPELIVRFETHLKAPKPVTFSPLSNPQSEPQRVLIHTPRAHCSSTSP